MPVKRRKSKRLLSPHEEMERWWMYFAAGTDYFDEIDQVLDPYRPSDLNSGALDDLIQPERELVVKDAWARLGGLFLESAEVVRRSRDDQNWKPYALRKYGPP